VCRRYRRWLRSSGISSKRNSITVTPAQWRSHCRWRWPLLQRPSNLDYRRSIASAVDDFCNVATSDEAQEGLRAFVEKRAPNW
jgi:hypothetical protein